MCHGGNKRGVSARAFAPAMKSGTLSRAHSTLSHTPSLIRRTTSPRPRLPPRAARASSHSRSGRSLSHSHPFTLDLKRRPIGLVKLFFFADEHEARARARRPSLMKSRSDVKSNPFSKVMRKRTEYNMPLSKIIMFRAYSRDSSVSRKRQKFCRTRYVIIHGG